MKESAARDALHAVRRHIENCQHAIRVQEERLRDTPGSPRMPVAHVTKSQLNALAKIVALGLGEDEPS